MTPFNAFELAHLKSAIVEKNVIDGVITNGAGNRLRPRNSAFGAARGTAAYESGGNATYKSINNIVRYNKISNCDSGKYSSGIALWRAEATKVYGNIVFNNDVGI